MEYKHIISRSEAKYFLNENKEVKNTTGNQQSSYNLPSEFLKESVENNILIFSENIDNKKLYKLSKEYRFKLGKGIICFIGKEFEGKENKFEILKATNKKIQLFRKYYENKSKVDDRYEWFGKLYDQNFSGNELIIKIDTVEKILSLDIKFNSVKELVDYQKIEDVVEENKVEYSTRNCIVKATPITNLPHNMIVFGAPGTGKSYKFKKFLDENRDDINYKRVTFHPNTSYSQFVGSYKPKFDRDLGQIIYKFIPGPFLEMLVAATNDMSKNYILVIEEINRANVSSVFGDVFQLLDRADNGESVYKIDIVEDIRDYLKYDCKWEEEKLDKIGIPSNMYIWATMNSADQGVMPMDTAFKRRWSFEHQDIDTGKEKIEGLVIKFSNYKEIIWNDLREQINKVLLEDLRINEDKLLGVFFLSEKEIMSEKIDDIFKSKVLMYLFQDVVRSNRRSFFAENINTFGELIQAFEEGKKIFVEKIKLEEISTSTSEI